VNLCLMPRTARLKIDKYTIDNNTRAHTHTHTHTLLHNVIFKRVRRHIYVSIYYILAHLIVYGKLWERETTIWYNMWRERNRINTFPRNRSNVNMSIILILYTCVCVWVLTRLTRSLVLHPKLRLVGPELRGLLFQLTHVRVRSIVRPAHRIRLLARAPVLHAAADIFLCT